MGRNSAAKLPFSMAYNTLNRPKTNPTPKAAKFLGRTVVNRQTALLSQASRTQMWFIATALVVKDVFLTGLGSRGAGFRDPCRQSRKC